MPDNKISTHALTWRATECKAVGKEAARISTHALTWRATRHTTPFFAPSSDFYPRPHMEGDMP